MIKYLFITFLIFNLSILSQTADTLFNVSDSLAVDTLSVFTSNDSLFVNDSTNAIDETVKPDSLIPIQGIARTDVLQIINKRTFLFYNYRYTGDFLRSFPFNFIKDLGFMGQPNETFVYGVGAGGISFMEDGVLWNNRFVNALDLNEIQSEDIDSIEIVPSPRGFLYGPYNNPVTVNFIMKDFLSPEPYSRIRYYEGPDGEAMFDGKFNARIAKKFSMSFQLTHRKTDSTFANNEFSMWQANTKLKYYLSNSINISAIYSFVDSDVGLNGGVDVDSIAQVTNDINSIIYDRQLAPVVYPNRGKSVVNHNFGLRFQAKAFDESNTDLIFYHRISRNEIKDHNESLSLKLMNDSKTSGVNLKHYQRIGVLSFELFGLFEKSNGDFEDYLNTTFNTSISDWEFTQISGGLDLSLHLLNDKLIPSVFYKYVNQSRYFKQIGDDNNILLTDETEGLSGMGTDLQFIVKNGMSFYAGASIFQQAELLSNKISEDTKTFELGGKYIGSNIFTDLKFFKRRGSSSTIPHYKPQNPAIVYGNLSGIGLRLNVNYWKFLIETNTSYYFNADEDKLLGVPELQFVGGLFVNGFFFDDNLLLKAGVQFYYTGANNVYSNVWEEIIYVEPSNKIDITVAGEIKGVAIVYFGWENLFNNQYFITPYYPMQERNIRFGISWELFN
ncbi:MAG: putative porin [Ignavibacteriaceae bacterium]